jgi:DNA mismatch repair ATPase MutS
VPPWTRFDRNAAEAAVLETRMFLDAATLEDLEILPSPKVRGLTLWSLVDRTRTRVGHEALRGRFLNPTHAVDDIIALQCAHQAVAAEADVYRRLIDRAAADDVEHYLNSPWQLPRKMSRFAGLRRWHREYKRDIEQGRLVVSSFLEAAAALRGLLGRTGAAILLELADDIGVVMDRDVMRELRRLASPPGSANDRFDQLAREGATSGLRRLLQCVGRIEAVWSVGVATAEHGWSYPRPSSRLRAVGLFHAFLGRDSVRNDIELADQVRIGFVTGPNMAGKSTFLKAIAVATFLAHTGAGVPAASMEFVPMHTLFSSVQVADNLSAGESFYLAEVRRIGALAAALADHGSALAIVDEPFRGTNVHDAVDATIAIITRLAKHPAALILVASHLGEVVPAIATDPRIALLSFAVDVTGPEPRFDYRLRPGVNEQRLGMTLLRQEGVLDLLDHAAEGSRLSESMVRPG